MVCGRLRVRLVKVRGHSDIVERKMEVKVTEDTANSLIVNAVQLISWPKEGLPHHRSIITLMEKSTGILMKSATKKTLVMCRSTQTYMASHHKHTHTYKYLPTLMHKWTYKHALHTCMHTCLLQASVAEPDPQARSSETGIHTLLSLSLIQ